MSQGNGGKQRSVSYTPFTTHSRLEAVNRFLSPSISIENFTGNEDFQKLECQVAGHQFIKGKDTIGLLKCKNGTVLKPVTKPEVGLREIDFYNQLQTTQDLSLIELRQYTPGFFGTRRIQMNDKNIEFIILENLLEGMFEPCIIDIKIGKQTWDPSASLEKIEREKSKYAQCKNDVGFCIPGFQVYKMSTGRLHKYNKEYGRKLTGSTVVDALKIFLNSDINGNVNRELLMQLLTVLWKIQKWAKRQRSVNLYSTSLLMTYDFRVLKKHLSVEKSKSTAPLQLKVVQRKVSFNSPESYSGDVSSSFSGQVSPAGPILTPFPTSPKAFPAYVPPNVSTESTQSMWQKTFNTMRRSHSFNLSYGDYLSKIKQDYVSTLAELNGDSKNDKQWCDVKIIDLAHVYPSDQTPDNNFIQGIDNIINIFENFLHTSS